MPFELNAGIPMGNMSQLAQPQNAMAPVSQGAAAYADVAQNQAKNVETSYLASKRKNIDTIMNDNSLSYDDKMEKVAQYDPNMALDMGRASYYMNKDNKSADQAKTAHAKGWMLGKLLDQQSVGQTPEEIASAFDSDKLLLQTSQAQPGQPQLPEEEYDSHLGNVRKMQTAIQAYNNVFDYMQKELGLNMQDSPRANPQNWAQLQPHIKQVIDYYKQAREDKEDPFVTGGVRGGMGAATIMKNDLWQKYADARDKGAPADILQNLLDNYNAIANTSLINPNIDQASKKTTVLATTLEGRKLDQTLQNEVATSTKAAGIQNAKVNMASHAGSLIANAVEKDEQGNIKYAKDKQGNVLKDELGNPIPAYKINMALLGELVTTTASLLAGSNQTSEGQRNELTMTSLDASIKEIQQYMSGHPGGTVPPEMINTYKHIIDRQGFLSEEIKDNRINQIKEDRKSWVNDEDWKTISKNKYGSSYIDHYINNLQVPDKDREKVRAAIEDPTGIGNKAILDSLGIFDIATRRKQLHYKLADRKELEAFDPEPQATIPEPNRVQTPATPQIPRETVPQQATENGIDTNALGIDMNKVTLTPAQRLSKQNFIKLKLRAGSSAVEAQSAADARYGVE